ncbi:MAG: UDP-N-acetylglucosamine--N-acetylmuramyl-(pentapeptide) pyrophosphoryl-undecaprenol N-acetylglucosamine transferase [Chloroflexota bacterium]|jgi:UDP-N-acetylglucosamine--N-acetylmuramyl-(pentapeptide) pyrophosphoryl-undecaprenol N-acetylglucosamine transferase
MRILIAAGGTGGHIYPALAVVTQLRTRLPELELRWLGGRRGLEREIVPRADITLDRLWLRFLRTVDVSFNSVLDPLRLLASMPQALWKLLRWRPDVVYTTGGYVAIPVLAAAALLRIPSMVWEGNQIPGRSVRLAARLATLRSVTFGPTAQRLPAPVLVTGTPIRELEGLDRATARQRLRLPADLPVMLVFGGSQEVRRLNEAVATALPDLVERCAVVHIAGGGIATAEEARRRLPADRQDRYRPVAFLDEDMGAALAAADLVVGRAGSSTLAECAAAGDPMVVVPYPHAAAHQRANAAELVDAGAAVLVDDADLDGDTLRQACDLLHDEPRLEAMSEAARAVGRPHAAAASAELLLRLSRHAPLPAQEEVDRLVRASSST